LQGGNGRSAHSPDIQQDDDLQKFALAQSYFTMTESAAWKDLMDRLDGMVLEAQNELFKSRETEPLKILEQKLRWQQRVATREAMSAVVNSQLTVREEIMEEMKEGEHEYAQQMTPEAMPLADLKVLPALQNPQRLNLHQ
jgi:hypothetical protein